MKLSVLIPSSRKAKFFVGNSVVETIGDSVKKGTVAIVDTRGNRYVYYVRFRDEISWCEEDELSLDEHA